MATIRVELTEKEGRLIVETLQKLVDMGRRLDVANRDLIGYDTAQNIQATIELALLEV